MDRRLLFLIFGTKTSEELFSGLVDALADPRAYLSAQEKRKEALHNMGVEDSDIVEVISGSVRTASTKNALLRLNGGTLEQSTECVLYNYSRMV